MDRFKIFLRLSEKFDILDMYTDDIIRVKANAITNSMLPAVNKYRVPEIVTLVIRDNKFIIESYEDKPSVIYENGEKEWHLNGKLHREIEPAYISDDEKIWVQYNEKIWFQHNNVTKVERNGIIIFPDNISSIIHINIIPKNVIIMGMNYLRAYHRDFDGVIHSNTN